MDGSNYVMIERDKFEFLTPVCPLPQNQNPCKVATWKTPSTRIKVSGIAVVLDDSGGECHNAGGAFTGILNVRTQSRVKGAL